MNVCVHIDLNPVKIHVSKEIKTQNNCIRSAITQKAAYKLSTVIMGESVTVLSKAIIA